MISEPIKKALIDNWGEQAEAMNCYCEVKFIDPLGHWACYIYALDPNDEDTIACLMDCQTIEICNWSLKELYFAYNREGEYPIVDEEFRRIRTAELFKRLSGDR